MHGHGARRARSPRSISATTRAAEVLEGKITRGRAVERISGHYGSPICQLRASRTRPSRTRSSRCSELTMPRRGASPRSTRLARGNSSPAGLATGTLAAIFGARDSGEACAAALRAVADPLRQRLRDLNAQRRIEEPTGYGCLSRGLHIGACLLRQHRQPESQISCPHPVLKRPMRSAAAPRWPVRSIATSSYRRISPMAVPGEQRSGDRSAARLPIGNT